MDFKLSTDGIINGGLTNAWKIILTSTNGSLKFVNFDPGNILTLVVQEDASGSNYTLTFPSNVIWSAGAGRTPQNTYVVTTRTLDGKRSAVKLHHLLLPARPGYYVDHVDCDFLNNQRENLRYVTPFQSNRNRRKQRTHRGNKTHSKYKGVTYLPGKAKPWMVRIGHQNEKRYLGCFETEEEAARTYNEGASQLFGEYARLNALS